MNHWSRRAFLAGIGGITAAPVLGNVTSSPRPGLRPGSRAVPSVSSAAPAPKDLTALSDALIAKYGMSGDLGFVVADARTGAVLATHNPDLPLPPASVTKAITTAYAFDSLGTGYRFNTRVFATGPVRNGQLEGDLILAGGGAPGLSTAGLASLTAQLKENGLRSVSGRFLFWDGALPDIDRIDPGQPDHLGYNPSVSGLNLNYNRVHFDWKRKGDDYVIVMDARDGSYLPPVSTVDMAIADRSLPVFDYTEDPENGRERWTVSRRALGGDGARWLPVRHSGIYTADVFRTLARSGGLDLPGPERVTALPGGTVLATQVSPPLAEIAEGMLRYSTNLSAEVLGLSATKARRLGILPSDLADSAQTMTVWARANMGLSDRSLLVDHSGLGDESRVTARDMTALMYRTGPEGALSHALHVIPLQQKNGKPEPLKLFAKTGTLNFVSALSGHITPTNGPPLVFAIFTADLDRRATIPEGDEENPPGSKPWTRRSRSLQYDLVRLWAANA
ncbi:D-alanyl-D-alanine carboxypeptidase/D-alanyl-D-alanine-endopeptidase [Pseudoruegeria sp. SK021]|uniref:D-alanyl-D-alanine carboxypeptidase/D-alanyl-D-alanine endopeptidase n=1 Tax=Pseudoruegeria sp. SK021 TaxID=1933035 RepID=UPI000A258283|nr:D-alanyl-D-alanine carboxypeptidase/D-alanyl-D-alanine-endopeptidase [Pseudoruegeria sp. SK021]OSP55749.1 D-alanyl-D-alanine carboxypeptidase/D-alanyl-D-alanine-endopeptidase [Pseudoruegeria sp. SK021]